MTGHTRNPPTPSAHDFLYQGPIPPRVSHPNDWSRRHPNHYNRTQRQAQQHTHKCDVSKVLLSWTPCSTAPTRKAWNPATRPELSPGKWLKPEKQPRKKVKLVSRNRPCRTVHNTRYCPIG